MVEKKIEKIDIERAYKLLKTYYYYDSNVTLNTKISIAKYETENILGKENWAEDFKNRYFNSEKSNDNIKEEIEKISVIRVIKSVESKEEGDKEFFQVLTNKTNINSKIKYNYIIDAPIEIHILSMLWIIKEGYLLDLEMSDDIYGNRLELNTQNGCIDFNKKNIFKRYYNQYSIWRDKALERVSDIVNKESSNAVLVNLDVKHYYYSIELETLYKNILQTNKNLNTFLFECIKRINKFYNKKVLEIEINEEDEEKIVKEDRGLPIGLLSSQILANFYLKSLDNEILKLLPDYYGRYVDDILIIFKDREEYKNKNIELEKYIDGKLDKIIEFKEKNMLKLKNYKDLILQKGKLKLYFFDKNSSNALLEAFKEGIRKNTSIFNLYNEEEEIDFVTEESLININYSGSKNKLSGIESFRNDKFKFSVKLSQLIMLYKEGNSNIKNKEKVANIILKHFNGNLSLDNFLILDKIFVFFLMNNLIKETNTFYISIKENIKKQIEEKNKQNDILNALKNSLIFAACFNYNKFRNQIKDLNSIESEEIVMALLNSNMYKHFYASCGIFTYLKNINKEEKILSKDLFNLDPLDIENEIEVDKEKIVYSPRFIHLDEIFMIFSLKKLNSFDKEILENTEKIYNYQFEDRNQIRKREYPIKIYEESKERKIKFFKFSSPYKKDKFNLGIVSINFAEKDIEEKVIYEKKITIEHVVKINKLLNEAIKNKVDILIFPEVCLHEKLLTKLVRFSRKNNIAIVGGLQYIKKNNEIYNLLINIFPFENNNYKTCFFKLRLKNYYSPGEEQLIKGYKYKIPVIDYKNYDLFSWKGLYFTIFNCFELTSLLDRALFKNYIDLMIASVYNRDIKYFRNIIDSTARDLHCYVAQVNVQKYGDSGVVVPKKSEMMVLSNIKGGINCNLLVTPIEIKSLREFQMKTIDYQSHDSCYKYTPPDIDEKLVRCRIDNELCEYLEQNSIIDRIFPQKQEKE